MVQGIPETGRQIQLATPVRLDGAAQRALTRAADSYAPLELRRFQSISFSTANGKVVRGHAAGFASP